MIYRSLSGSNSAPFNIQQKPMARHWEMKTPEGDTTDTDGSNTPGGTTEDPDDSPDPGMPGG